MNRLQRVKSVIKVVFDMCKDIDCDGCVGCENEETDVKEMKVGLSDRAIGVIILCIQKAILEEIDITGLFRGLAFQLDHENKLEIINPPNDLNIKLPQEILDQLKAEEEDARLN